MVQVMLRTLRHSYKTRIAQLANNKNIWDNVRDGFGHPYTEKNAEKFIKGQADNDTEKVFAVICNGEFCGLTGLILQKDVYLKSAEIGYWIGEPFWGRGIASQAIGLLARRAFDKLALASLYAGIFEYNVGSMRVLEKNDLRKKAFRKKRFLRTENFGTSIDMPS